MEDAKRKASEILLDAQEQYKALIEEHSIMQEAYQQAEETVRMANEEAAAIVDSARRQANEIGNGAIYYTTDMLANAEKVIAQAYETTVNNSKALETALSGYLEIIRRNRAELTPVEPEYEEPAQMPQEAEDDVAAYQSEFAPEEQ